MDDRTQLVAAIRRVNARIFLYVHLAVYVAVNVLLIAINVATSPGYHWFWWPLLGWGVGLGMHALATMLVPRLGSIRRRMIAKEVRR